MIYIYVHNHAWIHFEMTVNIKCTFLCPKTWWPTKFVHNKYNYNVTCHVIIAFPRDNFPGYDLRTNISGESTFEARSFF